MLFQVLIEQTAVPFSCRADESVLSAMTKAGIRSVRVGCRSGGCGICRVQVVTGEYEVGCMSAAQVSNADAANGFALACQIYPRSDLRIRLVSRLISDPESLLSLKECSDKLTQSKLEMVYA